MTDSGTPTPTVRPAAPAAAAAPVAAPETCVHNLHKKGDRERDAPVATDLCRNELGVFHMLDCPLFLGRKCTYYEEAPRPHPAVTDLDAEGARQTLHGDFLSWRYRRRVRLLSAPKELQGRRLVVEVAQEPDQDLGLDLVERSVKAAADAAAAALAAEGVSGANGAAGAPLPSSPAAEPATGEVPTAEIVPASPEMFPGQRRSEDRRARKMKKRLVAKRPLPVMNFPDDDPDDPDDPAPGASEPSADAAPAVPEAPKTIDQLFESLPEAKLPERLERLERTERPDRGPRPARGPRPQGPRRQDRGPRPQNGGRPDRRHERGPDRGPRGGPRPPQQGPRPDRAPRPADEFGAGLDAQSGVRDGAQGDARAAGAPADGAPQRGPRPHGGPHHGRRGRHDRDRQRGRHGGPGGPGPRDGGGPPPAPPPPGA